ncbi:hypothetical protein Y032_0286g1385 [Ancylostoma ceylanicum]|uniref:Uncharacterized protein n=1 Tax=Ancylostoma ceylanicum TaxID=53326 RepID=A0A016S6I3_9BILA|nr:hypothetical protein Y032_0286g1385 [Ancylostoma ceylanicum]
MNIEDLAKDTNKAKQPAKKKGYDDVDISDLSEEDDDKKTPKKKDVKKTPTKKPDAAKPEKKDKKDSEGKVVRH